MGGIEGGGSTYNLTDVSKAGFEGALTLSKRRIKNRLSARGFVNGQTSIINETRILPETAIVSSETSDTDSKEVSQWVTALRSGMKEEPDRAQDAQDGIQPDRAVSLLK